MSASSVIQVRLGEISKERAQAVSRLDLAKASEQRANADITRLDAERAQLLAALDQLGA